MHQTHYKEKNKFSIKPEPIDKLKRSTSDFRIGKVIGKGKLLSLNYVLIFNIGSYALVKIVKDKITGIKCVWKVYEKYRLHT